MPNQQGRNKGVNKKSKKRINYQRERARRFRNMILAKRNAFDSNVLDPTEVQPFLGNESAAAVEYMPPQSISGATSTHSTHATCSGQVLVTHTSNRPTDFHNMPPELQMDPGLWKFWKKRYYLWPRYDDGIQMNKESWYSVTPEPIARIIAEKSRYNIIIDAFCGVGGNTIQFAMTCGEKVLAIEIDPKTKEKARSNSYIYGVTDRIEFVDGDFFKLAPFLKADMVFLSPPWGGPDYVKDVPYDIETMLQPRPASELIKVARSISSVVTLYLPRNANTEQIKALAGVDGSVEIQKMWGGPTGQGTALQALVAYYTFNNVLTRQEMAV